MQFHGNISLGFSGNYEAFASELLENVFSLLITNSISVVHEQMIVYNSVIKTI